MQKSTCSFGSYLLKHIHLYKNASLDIFARSKFHSKLIAFRGKSRQNIGYTDYRFTKSLLSQVSRTWVLKGNQLCKWVPVGLIFLNKEILEDIKIVVHMHQMVYSFLRNFAYNVKYMTLAVQSRKTISISIWYCSLIWLIIKENIYVTAF